MINLQGHSRNAFSNSISMALSLSTSRSTFHVISLFSSSSSAQITAPSPSPHPSLFPTQSRPLALLLLSFLFFLHPPSLQDTLPLHFECPGLIFTSKDGFLFAISPDVSSSVTRQPSFLIPLFLSFRAESSTLPTHTLSPFVGLSFSPRFKRMKERVVFNHGKGCDVRSNRVLLSGKVGGRKWRGDRYRFLIGRRSTSHGTEREGKGIPA